MLGCPPPGNRNRCRHLPLPPNECSRVWCGGRLCLGWPHPGDWHRCQSRPDTSHSDTVEGSRWSRRPCWPGTDPSCQTLYRLHLAVGSVLQLFPLFRRLLPPRGRKLGHRLGPRLPWLARSRFRHAPVLGLGTSVTDTWQTRPHFHAFQHIFYSSCRFTQSVAAFQLPTTHTPTTTIQSGPRLILLSWQGVITDAAQVCPPPPHPRHSPHPATQPLC